MLDGRASIEQELQSSSDELQRFVGDGLGELVADSYFVEALEGYFDRSVAAARARRLLELMSRLRPV